MKKFLLSFAFIAAFTSSGFAQDNYDEVGDKTAVSTQDALQQIAVDAAKNALKLDKLFGKDDKEMTSGLVTLDALYLTVQQASKLTSDNSTITKAIVDKKATAAMLKQYKNNSVSIAKLTKDTPGMVSLVPSEILGIKDQIKAHPAQAIKLGKNLAKANKMFKNCKEALEIIKTETASQAKVMKSLAAKK